MPFRMFSTTLPRARAADSKPGCTAPCLLKIEIYRRLRKRNGLRRRCGREHLLARARWPPALRGGFGLHTLVPVHGFSNDSVVTRRSLVQNSAGRRIGRRCHNHNRSTVYASLHRCPARWAPSATRTGRSHRLICVPDSRRTTTTTEPFWQSSRHGTTAEQY